MSRILLKGEEVALGTNTGAANAFSSARLVRLVNTSNSNQVVTLVATVGGSVVGSFTLPSGSVAELEKEPLQGIFAGNTAVRGAAVGYTN
tara:strand:- start:185 stop:454 length:270 start_codon:yes stop_codon:yes gene_type:complete